MKVNNTIIRLLVFGLVALAVFNIEAKKNPKVVYRTSIYDPSQGFDLFGLSLATQGYLISSRSSIQDKDNPGFKFFEITYLEKKKEYFLEGAYQGALTVKKLQNNEGFFLLENGKKIKGLSFTTQRLNKNSISFKLLFKQAGYSEKETQNILNELSTSNISEIQILMSQNAQDRNKDIWIVLKCDIETKKIFKKMIEKLDKDIKKVAKISL